MLDFFKKGEGEEDKQVGLIRGLSYGLGGALIILIVILLIVFGGKLKDKIGGGDNEGDDTTLIVGELGEPSKLRITILTSRECGDKCFDIELFLGALRQMNVEETGLETLYVEDNQGKELAERYAVTKLPTVLISGELDKNPLMAQAWTALGDIIDGVFVFRQLIPPYVEFPGGNLRGEFSVVYLTDDSCDECYDVNLHTAALTNLGLLPVQSTTVDVGTADGQDLVDKYNISLVPTIILNGDLAEYQSLQQIWAMVGNVTNDGSYVFTGLSEMGTHKNLETGKIVVVEVPEITTQ